MNSHFVGDVTQRVIKMRQMTAGQIANERALNFVVTNATMQPSQKKCELHKRGNKYCDPKSCHSFSGWAVTARGIRRGGSRNYFSRGV